MPTDWSRRAAAALLLLLAPVAAAADSQPATRPAADYSDPRRAVQSFLRAADDAAMRDALLIDPAHRQAIDSFLGVMVATTRLRTAAEAQFGAGAAKYFSAATDAQLDARIKAIDAAPLQVNGDTATLAIPADEASRQSGGTVIVRKTPGGWKVDAATLLGVTGMAQDKLAARMKLADTITAVTNQMIQDVNARKFASAGDAYQEYWNRTREAAARQPTTRP
jgi:hypothetical protein